MEFDRHDLKASTIALICAIKLLLYKLRFFKETKKEIFYWKSLDCFQIIAQYGLNRSKKVQSETVNVPNINFRMILIGKVLVKCSARMVNVYLLSRWRKKYQSILKNICFKSWSLWSETWSKTFWAKDDLKNCINCHQLAMPFEHSCV